MGLWQLRSFLNMSVFFLSVLYHFILTIIFLFISLFSIALPIVCSANVFEIPIWTPSRFRGYFHLHSVLKKYNSMFLVSYKKGGREAHKPSSFHHLYHLRCSTPFLLLRSTRSFLSFPLAITSNSITSKLNILTLFQALQILPQCLNLRSAKYSHWPSHY